MMATGNEPHTEGLGLENGGVALKKDAIAGNEYLETSVKGIYAIGDATGGSMLAHVASYQGEIAVENAMGHRRKADYRSVPNCVFSSPEIAAVGMTEEETRSAGIPYKVSRFPFSASSRALTLGRTVGLVKYVCEEGTGKVLGMHIMGPHASDIIAEAALAIQMGATARDIAETIHAHPTLPESIREAALAQFEGAIHFRRV